MVCLYTEPKQIRWDYDTYGQQVWCSAEEAHPAAQAKVPETAASRSLRVCRVWRPEAAPTSPSRPTLLSRSCRSASCTHWLQTWPNSSRCTSHYAVSYSTAAYAYLGMLQAHNTYKLERLGLFMLPSSRAECPAFKMLKGESCRATGLSF